MITRLAARCLNPEPVRQLHLQLEVAHVVGPTGDARLAHQDALERAAFSRDEEGGSDDRRPVGRTHRALDLRCAGQPNRILPGVDHLVARRRGVLRVVALLVGKADDTVRVGRESSAQSIERGRHGARHAREHAHVRPGHGLPRHGIEDLPLDDPGDRHPDPHLPVVRREWSLDETVRGIPRVDLELEAGGGSARQAGRTARVRARA